MSSEQHRNVTRIKTGWLAAKNISLQQWVERPFLGHMSRPLLMTNTTGLDDSWILGCVRTSLRSAMVKFMPASCFHTGSARFRLRGLPVRIAMPRSTPADTARQSALPTDQTRTIVCQCAMHGGCGKTAEVSVWNEACSTAQARCFISERAHEAFVHF